LNERTAEAVSSTFKPTSKDRTSEQQRPYRQRSSPSCARARALIIFFPPPQRQSGELRINPYIVAEQEKPRSASNHLTNCKDDSPANSDLHDHKSAPILAPHRCHNSDDTSTDSPHRTSPSLITRRSLSAFDILNRLTSPLFPFAALLGVAALALPRRSLGPWGPRRRSHRHSRLTVTGSRPFLAHCPRLLQRPLHQVQPLDVNVRPPVCAILIHHR
jgi:hypothetical protein